MNKRQKKKLNKRHGYRKYSRYKRLTKFGKKYKKVLEFASEVISEMSKTTKYNFSQTTNDFSRLLTFKHDDNTSLCKKPARHPNKIECDQFLINYLWDLKCLSKISTCQYRTVKGQIRRGYIDIGMNFITNHSDISKQQLQYRYDEYKTSEIFKFEIVRKLETPVNLVCVYATLKQDKE